MISAVFNHSTFRRCRRAALAAPAAILLLFGTAFAAGTADMSVPHSRIITGEIHLPPGAAHLSPSDILVWSGRDEYVPSVQTGDGKILFAVLAPEDGPCVVSTLVRMDGENGENVYEPFLSAVVLPGETDAVLDSRSSAEAMDWILAENEDDEENRKTQKAVR